MFWFKFKKRKALFNKKIKNGGKEEVTLDEILNAIGQLSDEDKNALKAKLEGVEEQTAQPPAPQEANEVKGEEGANAETAAPEPEKEEAEAANNDSEPAGSEIQKEDVNLDSQLVGEIKELKQQIAVLSAEIKSIKQTPQPVDDATQSKLDEAMKIYGN